MTSRPIQPEDLFKIITPGDVQLSPDGSRVAYVRTHIDPEQDEYRSSIWIIPAGGGEPRQFTRGHGQDLSPRWSPDGTHLVFLSNRAGGPPQLYLLPVQGGEPYRLTFLPNGAGPASWSPDGRRLLFAARVFREPPPSEPLARARWDRRPRHITRASYKDDGRGYTFDSVSQLFVLDLPASGPVQITQGDADCTTPSWSPDGRQVAFARDRGGQTEYHQSDILLASADGSSALQVSTDIGRATSPTWSPDGMLIACYGGDRQEPGLGDPLVRVWMLSPAAGQARAVTADYDYSVVLLAAPAVTPGPAWSADGNSLTFTAAIAGNQHIVRARVDAEPSQVQPIVRGDRQVQAFSVSESADHLAFVAFDQLNPGDVYLCRLNGAQERRLTHLNESLLSELAFPHIERRAFRSPNGGALEGWILRPPTPGSGPTPLLVDIHGGPHGSFGNLFFFGYFYRYVLPSRGWTVLLLNPSGSGSYGRAFAHSLRGRWGEYDLPEQQAAVDTLIADGIADPNRLAVAGYSYGGFMTAWTITHTGRYKAAVVGAPVVNQESMFGSSDIGMWFGPWEFKDGLFTNRETYRRLSPAALVDRVTTPTLVLHGEADDRCPIGQGEEFYVGLVAAGRVPTEFVRYPGASHLFMLTGIPSHRLDFSRRIIDWLERYTPSGSTGTNQA